MPFGFCNKFNAEYNSKLYYEKDAPVISDYEYDAMFRELSDLEAIADAIRAAGFPDLHLQMILRKKQFLNICRERRATARARAASFCRSLLWS